MADATGELLHEIVASFDELRQALAAYGRRLEDVPLVIQYNKRDIADPYQMEAMHRKLGVDTAAVFEATATDGKGVLETLSTISKRVIRTLREGAEPAPSPAAPAAPPSADRMEDAILREADDPAAASLAHDAEDLLETPAWEQVAGEIERPTGVRLGPDTSIVSVGQASREGARKVRVPLVLGDASGQTTTVALTIELDPLLDESQ